MPQDVVPQDLVPQLERARSSIASFDVASCGDAAPLIAHLAALEHACAALRARLAVLAGSSVDDMARVTGTSTAAAARELATAAHLDELPLTRDAVSSGVLSLSQAHEIVSTAAVCPTSEATMVATAARESLQVLRDVGRRIRLAAIDVDELRAKQLAARSHRQWTDELGMVQYRGAMLPEHGMPFARRVDVATDRRFRAAGDVSETREQLAADAFAEIVAGGGRAHATRADVVYVCDVTTGTTKLVGSGPVPRAVFDAAARDGFVKAVTHDGVHVQEVAHYGRKALPAALRTAIELGDPPDFDGRRCVDCGRVLGLETDHVDPVAHGGPTCAGNVRDRCRPCHRRKTERDRAAGLLGAGARAP